MMNELFMWKVVDQGKSLAALLPDIELPLGGGRTRNRGQKGSTSGDQNVVETLQNVTVAVSIRGNFHRSVLTEAMSWHAIATGDMVSSPRFAPVQNMDEVQLI